MTLIGAPELQAKLARLDKGLGSIAKQVAVASQPDVVEAVRADLGDRSMSGWSRGRPLEIGATSVREVSGETVIAPKGRTVGPMRVLQDGRNSAGGVGGFQGPGINFRTGQTGARARATGRGGSRKGRRYNGQTRGKNTWDDAQKLVAKSLPKRSRAALDRVMTGIFTKG